MAIHLLSNELKDCKKFIKKFTGEKMENTNKLEDIKKNKFIFFYEL